MKKSITSLIALATAVTLAGCGESTTPHEHTFKDEWSTSETHHWHQANCEHTDLVKDLSEHNFGDDNICDDCLYEKEIPTPIHEHSFAGEWSKDETNHWHAATCEHTDLTKDLAEHKFGDDDVCDECGYVKPAPAHEHTFSIEWAKDAENHWHVATCEHGNLISGLAAHNFGGDNICEDCGYVKPIPEVPHEHSFSDAWSKDETNHWHAATCEHADLTKDLAEHNFGGDDICDDCGYVKPAPAHEHTFATEWSKDETNHWHAATCEHTDLTKDFAEHKFGDDDVCDDCGYVKPAPAHEHSFSGEWSKDETSHWHAATCEHTDLTKDLSAHNYGDDNICDTCGYELIVKEQHIVYFASNGGSNVQPVLVSDGEKVSIPEEPTKENYVFLGWYESQEYTGNTYDFEQKITKNTTLYALWGAKISFINYDGETYHNENVRLNTKIGEPTDPSWGEAHFLGWYESPDFNGTTFDFELGINKNTTLYARYGYAVELVGLNGQTVSTTLQPVDEVIAYPGDTTIDYYDFDNYYSDSEYTQLFEFGKKLTKDTKIYLKFIPKTYSITYEALDALENLNPTSYVYGIGTSNLLEPTVPENKKFYGWYFDNAYTQPATSISTELHENVTLYAKIGIYYTITYNGWPKTIENPNPTKITQYDYIELDKSPLEAIEGISGVKFMFDGEEETSKFINVSADITFDVVFSSPKTTITFDPNGGLFLPKNPFIYIDGPELAGGKKKIEITNNNGTFNLYNHTIMDELESTLGDKGIFEGFYTDSEFKNPLSTTSIGANKILNGSTIYAKFEENAETNIPFETHNTWDELPGSDHYRLQVYDFAIPEGVTTISLNLKVLAANDATHVLQLYDTTNKRNKIGDWSGRGKFEVNESINVVDMSKIQLAYNYGGDQSSFYNYSLSIKPETRGRCFVQCVSSGESITEECYYYHTPEIPYVSIEKEYFSFDGWLDSNNNKVDLTSDWVKTDEEVTLKANWIYSGHSVFANEIEKYAQRCSELLNRTDLDIENQDRLLALNRLNGTLLKVRGQFNLDPNRGYDQDLIEYNKSIEELNKTMWDWFGELYNGQLIDKRIEILNEYSSKGDAFVEAIRSTINEGLLELASLKNNPFEYHNSYIRTLTTVEAVLVAFGI